MPSPYSERNPNNYLGYLSALGSGATGPQTANATNASPVVLTGTFQTIAILAKTLGQGNRVNITGQLVGTNTSPGVDAELHIQVLQDGVPISPDVISAMPTTGDAATTSWTVFALVPSAGTHSYTVQAKATGDGGITIAANDGLLNFSAAP